MHVIHVPPPQIEKITTPLGMNPDGYISVLSLPPGPLQLVLAGDPHQLGPVLASRLAGSLGLSLSLLERIMAREPYLRDPVKYSDHGSYDPLMVSGGPPLQSFYLYSGTLLLGPVNMFQFLLWCPYLRGTSTVFGTVLYIEVSLE